MAKLCIEVKQHTPLIHFQAQQSNAFLRGSELKPKLDRFLINTFKNKDIKYHIYLIKKSICSNTCKNSHKEAFDYKVKIYNYSPVEVTTIDRRFPMFFGNIGNYEDIDTQYQFVFSNKPFNIEFFSYHTELLNHIKEYFPRFLMNENFGNRKSKGFGSFFIDTSRRYTLDGKKGLYDSDKIEAIKKLDYQFTVSYKKVNDKDRKSDTKKMKTGRTEKLSNYEKWNSLFSQIQTFYDSLRKGLEKNTIDPFIKFYAVSKGKQWEKDYIREIYVNQNKSTTEDICIFKDLFGLSSNERWDSLTISKEHQSQNIQDQIERFPSPLFFKPIETTNGYNIHIRVDEIDKRFLGQTFVIKNKNDKGRSISLKTPSDFDFHSFFDFVMDNCQNYPSDVKEINEQIKKNM